jgi:transposase
MSSKKIDGCISVIDEKQQVIFKSKIVFSNNIEGFEKLESWVLKWQDPSIPLVVCMEATGIYHENCALFLFEKNYKTSIILAQGKKKNI